MAHIPTIDELPRLVGSVDAPHLGIRHGATAESQRVFVSFVVDESGAVVAPTVSEGGSEALADEAIRGIQSARFRPWRQIGQPVRMRLTLPIVFQSGQPQPESYHFLDELPILVGSIEASTQ